MGADGHVSGILPYSQALTAKSLTHGYEGGGFTRLTTTFEALKKMDETILVSYGENKWPQLGCIDDGGSSAELPVRVLTDIANVTVYTDYNR